MQSPTVAIVVVAAGRSRRMGTADPSAPRKPLRELGGRPLIRRTLDALVEVSELRQIVLVGHADDLGDLEQAAVGLGLPVRVVAGGKERSDSVRIGTDAVEGSIDVIAIHDGARPFVEARRVDELVRVAHSEGGALLALPSRDTLWQTDSDGNAAGTIDRDRIWAAHTPQAFRASDLRALQARAHEDGFRPTDDAGLWARYRGAPALVEDTPLNFKITTPDDLDLARALIAAREAEETDD